MTSTTTNSSGPKLNFRFHPRLWIAAGLLLAVPAVAMRLTKEINWGPEDFTVAAIMLVVLCGAIEAALNWLTALRWRISAAALAVLLFLTLWVHLAVGLFD